MPHGGKRNGAGRKSRAEEEKLKEKLSPLDDKAFSSLEAGVTNGDYNFTKMFFEYRFGKPTEKHEIDGEITVNSIKIVDVDGTEI